MTGERGGRVSAGRSGASDIHALAHARACDACWTVVASERLVALRADDVVEGLAAGDEARFPSSQ